MKYGKIDLTYALNGAIAGLVSITAGPDLQNHLLAVLIGAVGGILVVVTVPILDRLKIDDVVGAIPHTWLLVFGARSAVVYLVPVTL